MQHGVDLPGVGHAKDMLNNAAPPRRFWHACSLRTTGYPYVALLAFSGTRTKLIAALEGRTSAEQLQSVLQQAVSAHEGHLAVEQADANERVCCCFAILSRVRFLCSLHSPPSFD